MHVLLLAPKADEPVWTTRNGNHNGSLRALPELEEEPTNKVDLLKNCLKDEDKRAVCEWNDSAVNNCALNDCVLNACASSSALNACASSSAINACASGTGDGAGCSTTESAVYECLWCDKTVSQVKWQEQESCDVCSAVYVRVTDRK